MKKSIFSLLLILSANAFAYQHSCSVFFNPDDLQLTALERTKVGLLLEKKNYNVKNNQNMFDIDHAYVMDGVKLTDKRDNKGKAVFEINRILRPAVTDEKGKITQEAVFEKSSMSEGDVEVVLSNSMGAVKVLKPKQRLFGILKDEGSPGFKLAVGLVRDLPKCKKEIKINDADRSAGKDKDHSPSKFGGIFSSSSVFGF